MNAINTTLTTSGNSVAVRLPKELLRMSGLGTNVTLEVKQGKIIISKTASPRANWEAQIKTLADAGLDSAQEFSDMNVAASDGLEDLEWDGPSFEKWQKSHAKLS